MKTLLILAIISLGFIFSAFEMPYSNSKINNIQLLDSIPKMNQQILVFVKSKLKKKVGTGECWDLASEALKAVNATWDMKYKFGKELNYKNENILPGDIIQFEGVVLKYDVNEKEITEKMLHHTAIIYEVKDNTHFTLAHQNNGYSGRKVGLSLLDLSTIKKGKIKIYRAQ